MLNRSIVFVKMYNSYLISTKMLGHLANYYFCHDLNNQHQEHIWRQLGIDILKKELELNDNKQEVENIFYLSQEKLARLLINFEKYILQNMNMLQQELSILQTTPDLLIQDINNLRKLINCSFSQQHPFNSKIFTFFLQYYQRNHFGKVSLSIIVDTVIKMNYFMLLKKKGTIEVSILNSSPEIYKGVWSKIKIIPLSEQKAEKDYRRLLHLMRFGIGFIQQTNLLEQKHLIHRLAIPLRLESNKRIMLKGLEFFINPSLSLIHKLNQIQTGMIGKMIQLTLPKIETNKMIYIPAQGNFKENIDIFQKGQGNIPIRMLYNGDIPPVNEGSTIQNGMINIHGGGWMLFTSFISQNHTRIWSKQTNMIIFSIDYRLAPQHPFPQAVQDCLQAYRFLTQQIHKYFNINLKKILISGDSAGGSLACALTAILLKRQLRLPNSIFLMYPSLDLRKIFYPSRLHAITDLILNPSFAEFCISSYLKSKDDQLNPLASPLLITEEFVNGQRGNYSFPKKWPSTHIIVGSKDPLRDESLLLMQKMSQANVECQCTIFQGFKHGFMNTERFIRQSNIPFRHSVDIIKKMIVNAK